MNASAQVRTALLLGNYNRMPIGEVGSLEGGAFTARVDDATSLWYNPAGLAAARSSSVSGNANIYEQLSLSYGESGQQTTQNQIPSFFGGLFKGNTFAVGYGITTPIHFTNNARSIFSGQQLGEVYPEITQLQTSPIDGYLESNITYTVLSPGVGLAMSIADWLRIGAGAKLYYVDMNSSFHMFLKQSNGVAPNLVLSDNSSQSASAVLSGVDMGFQVDLGSKIKIGFSARSETTQLSGQGTTRGDFSYSEDNDADGNGATDSRYTYIEYVLPQSVPFTINYPRTNTLGVAYTGDQAELEGNMICYERIIPYEVFGGGEIYLYEKRYRAEATTPNGSVRGEPLRYSGEFFCNLAVGLRWKSSQSLHFHGGYYTDYSPEGDVNDLFTELSGEGITYGVTFMGKNSSATFGLVQYTSEWSALHSFPLRVESDSLVLSGSYYF